MQSMQLMLYLFPLQLINLWAIWHAYTHSFATPLQRVMWLCVAIFLPLLGGLLYFLGGRKNALQHK